MQMIVQTDLSETSEKSPIYVLMITDKQGLGQDRNLSFWCHKAALRA
jgi:hypothetical protein